MQDKIELLKNQLQDLLDWPNIGDIRQQGLMVGIEIVKNKDTKESFDYADGVGRKICAVARNHNLLIRPLGDVIILMPPLSIKPDEIRQMLSAVKKSLKEVLR